MSPDLAIDILGEAGRSWGASLADCLVDSEVELEELLQLNATAAEEARANGVAFETIAALFLQLQELLEKIMSEVVEAAKAHAQAREEIPINRLVMEDVDLDLELAAM